MTRGSPDIKAGAIIVFVLALLAVASPLRSLWARPEAVWWGPFAVWLTLVAAGFWLSRRAGRDG